MARRISLEDLRVFVDQARFQKMLLDVLSLPCRAEDQTHRRLLKHHREEQLVLRSASDVRRTRWSWPLLKAQVTPAGNMNSNCLWRKREAAGLRVSTLPCLSLPRVQQASKSAPDAPGMSFPMHYVERAVHLRTSVAV